MADSAMNNKNDVEDAAAVTTLDKTNNNRPVVLKVEHVAKSFRLPTEQASGLKMAFLNWTRGIKGYTEQQVLRDINFEVHQGDFFGIVGRNGRGPVPEIAVEFLQIIGGGKILQGSEK